MLDFLTGMRLPRDNDLCAVGCRYDRRMESKILSSVACIAAMKLVSGCGGPAIGPPPDTEIRMIEEEIHGVNVQDPYRWLEESDTTETRD